MRRKILAFMLGAGLLGAGAWVGWPREIVVLVVLDTVRADAARGRFLDDLAARSTVYRNARSTSSWTAPSTASLFTGLYPTEHGVVGGFRAQQRAAGVEVVLRDPDIALRGMPPDVPTLPERFRAAGWRTLGVASNVNIGTELGFDRGFDWFHLDRTAEADALLRRMTAWLVARGPGRPTFVYLHLNDAHQPYKARAPYWRRPARRSDEERAKYDSEIAAMDAALGRFVARVSWWGAPRVVVVSDHGEAFGEHGQEGHVFTLHAEVNDIALIVHEPGGPAAVVDTPVSLVDVPATVLDLVGIPASGSLRDGVAEDRVLFAHRASPVKATTLWSAVSGRYKLIVEEGSGRPPALYDTEADPGELVDVAAEHPDVVARLTAELAAFQARTGHVGAAVTVEVDAELMEHLTELGYVGED